MEIEPFVNQVAGQFTAAAALGDDRTKQIAEALASSSATAVRLSTIRAISAAIEEVNAALIEHVAGLTFSVRIRDDEPVIQCEPVTAATSNPLDDLSDIDGGDASARISLRLSETLKADVDQAAADASVSVNTWLVRAARAALSRGPGQSTARTGHHVRGWVTG